MIEIVCLTITLIISIIINLATIIIILNNLKKIDVYEQWVIIARNRCHQTYLRMKSVDDRGMFEKDDDVGFVFSELLQITKELDEKIENVDEEDEEINNEEEQQ